MRIYLPRLMSAAGQDVEGVGEELLPEGSFKETVLVVEDDDTAGFATCSIQRADVSGIPSSSIECASFTEPAAFARAASRT